MRLEAPGRRLEGKRVLVLRPEGQAGELSAALAAKGAEPVVVPAIRILPPLDWGGIDRLLASAGAFSWAVFTSANGVEALFSRADGLGSAVILPVGRAAVGPATREALARRGVRAVWIPSAFTTAALARELPGPPAPVALVRAEMAGTELEEVLEARGFPVERFHAYRTRPLEGAAIAAALGKGVHAVAFTSASIVEVFASAVGDPPDLRGAAAFAIGPATADACRRAGIEIAGEATEHTLGGLVEAIAAGL